MRRGGRLFIFLGVGLALVAVLLAVMSLKGHSKPKTVTNPQTEMVTVIQATKDIPANTVISQDDIKSVQVEKATAPAGAAQDSSQVLGLATNGNLVKGQQIMMANLVSPGLTNMLTNGKRAVALPIDRVSALGGLIRPDDYVDIVYSVRLDLTGVLPTNVIQAQQGNTAFTFKDGELKVVPPGQTPAAEYPYPGNPGSEFIVTDGQKGNPVTKVILQNIRVLRVIAGNEAVNNTTSAAPANGTPTPTTAAPTALPNADLLVLEVDPQQAELVKFLEDNQGQYQVILRAADDHAIATTTGITYDQLMSKYGLPAPKTVKLPSGGH